MCDFSNNVAIVKQQSFDNVVVGLACKIDKR